MFISSGGGVSYSGNPLCWVRFKDLEDEDYCYHGSDTKGAIIFKAKRNVAFTGFLWNVEWNNNAFTMNIKYRKNEEEFCDEAKFDPRTSAEK